LPQSLSEEFGEKKKMRGYNKAIIAGNCTADPQTKYTASGTAVCNFTVACNDNFKDRDGNLQERTEFLRVVAWGKLAEICGQYINKGKPVLVEGSIRTRSWDDQDGNKKYMTEINAREVQFLGGGAGNDSSGGGGYGGPPDDDTIPF
jgi:single-strand DNA-binding protein